uniref:DP2 n=1 Tax=Arundo donax TaxID=35708 RepID=A0A0A9HQL5_ARUDO
MLPFPLIGRFLIQLFSMSRKMAFMLQLRSLHLILMGALPKPQ